MWFQTISTYVDSRDVSQESLCIKLSTILCWVSTVVYNYIYTYDIHNNQHKSNAGNYVGHQVIHVVCACVCCFKKLCLSNLQFALIKHQWFVGQCPPKIPKEVSTCYVSCSLLKLCFFLLVHPHLCCWLNLISRLF